ERAHEHALVANTREARRDLLGHLVPEHVAEARRVRLGRAGDDPATPLGQLERVAEHPLDADTGKHARLDPDLDRKPLVRPAADARVLALGVLAEEEHVDVLRPAACERGRDPLQQPDGTQVGPEVEPLPDLEDQAPEREVVGHRPVTDRAHQHGGVAVEDLAPVGGHHPAVLVPVGRAPGKLRPLDVEAECVDRHARLGDHLRADPVAGEEGDSVTHTPAPTATGTLSTYSSTSSSETTSAYLALMSNRFASCGACARSATHSRGTSVG